MRYPPLVRDALDQLTAVGLAAEIRQSGHFQIRFVNHAGRRCLLVISKSPSRDRAFHRNRAELRRLLRRY